MKSRNPTLHPATYGDKTTPVQKFVQPEYITDEMVEKARDCFVNEYPYRSDGRLSGRSARPIRAALEAVAPMLIAAYLRKQDMGGDLYLRQLFNSLAQELDPQ